MSNRFENALKYRPALGPIGQRHAEFFSMTPERHVRFLVFSSWRPMPTSGYRCGGKYAMLDEMQKLFRFEIQYDFIFE